MSARTLRSPRLRPGGTLVKVLLLLPIIVGVAALCLDGGRMMDQRRSAQEVADAAALAAGNKLYLNDSTAHGLDLDSSARTAALQVAAANGYASDAVTVNIPPTSGTYAGQAGYAEVQVSTSVQASFGKMFTGQNVSVGARSVARGQPTKIGIVLLRSTGAASFNNSAAAFAVVNKPLVVNSNDPAAFTSTGLVIANLNRIDVTGGAVNSSLLSVGTPIRTGVRPTADPLADLPVPSLTSATVRSSTPLTISSVVPTILQPGIYRGGIRVTGLGIVIMQPGVYIMDGGGFVVDGSGTVTGLGVMVYNTYGTYPAGSISVTGLGKVVMTAPTSGTYQGMNFFQNRGMTQPVTVSGLGLTTITGGVYAMKAPVNLSGSAAVGLDIQGGAYVADSMTVTGVGAVTVSLGSAAPRVPDVRLVE